MSHDTASDTVEIRLEAAAFASVLAWLAAKPTADEIRGMQRLMTARFDWADKETAACGAPLISNPPPHNSPQEAPGAVFRSGG